MYALAITDLVKRYPTGTEALKGVSIEIEEGEFYGLLGPNGAGKSTLIHCTTGLAQPTSGSIEIFGHDAVHHYGDARVAVGLAPQEPNLDWFLTIEETLDYHGGYFGMPRKDRRERATELLEAFSLTDKRHERTRFLSGGMKRRLILARALMHRPKLLILDEPTAGVDVELRLELWHYMQRINRKRARRSCSPRTTSKRPSSCATRSPSSTAARSSRPARAATSRVSTACRAWKTRTSRWSGAASSRAPTSR